MAIGKAKLLGLQKMHSQHLVKRLSLEVRVKGSASQCARVCKHSNWCCEVNRVEVVSYSCAHYPFATHLALQPRAAKASIFLIALN